MSLEYSEMLLRAEEAEWLPFGSKHLRKVAKDHLQSVRMELPEQYLSAASKLEVTLNNLYGSCYVQIFDDLASFSVEVQKQLVVPFFEKYNSPDGFSNPKKIGEELVKINNHEFLGFNSETSKRLIVEAGIEAQAWANHVPPNPVRLISGNFEEIAGKETFENRQTSASLQRQVAKESGRETSWSVLRSMARSVARRALSGTSWDTGRRAGGQLLDDVSDYFGWICLEDILGNKNPGQPLMEIYESGGFPLGRTSSEYLIFVPSVK